jgi:hypothetical protein
MKSIKVIWNGKRLKDIYPHATKWQVFKYRVYKFFHKLMQMTVLTTILAIVVTTAFVVGRYSKADVAMALDVQPSFDSKVDGLKNGVVDEIANCESRNSSQDTALVVYDNNSKGTIRGKDIASIGVMQFKVSTVQAFWKQLHKENLSNYEATLLALDNKKAKDLAKDAIFNIQGSVWNWTCATKTIGEKVAIIKSLEK